VPLDSSATLFYASLAMSAAAVVLFLWLIREPRDVREDPRRARAGGSKEKTGDLESKV
jgi:hypothetical protein